MHNHLVCKRTLNHLAKLADCCQSHKACVCSFFYQIFIFSPNNSPSKTMKNVSYLKSSFHSQYIHIFLFFSLHFHLFQIQKGK